ncbi:MAG: Rrf2 family transcriptional regulator [Gemmatimonadetes bacterium]|nr:MAG: Rrf2 family transcriptional regulator [Gemmatimonadota bacterium]
MVLFSKPAQYGLRAVAYIASLKDNVPVAGEIIAREENIPKHFLSKLLQQLVQAKILTSIKGPNGGFSLVKDPATITLYQIINVFEDLDNRLESCVLGLKRCEEGHSCTLDLVCHNLRKSMRHYLTEVSIADFASARVQGHQLDRLPFDLSTTGAEIRRG